MVDGTDYPKKILEAIQSNEKTRILYNIDGMLEINSQSYEIGKPSFSEVASAVLAA